MNIIEKLDSYWYKDDDSEVSYHLKPLTGMDAYHILSDTATSEEGGIMFTGKAAEYIMKNNVLGWDVKDDEGKDVIYTARSYRQIYAKDIKGICYSLLENSELTPDDKKKSPSITP